jgi:hypothetical protein
LDRPNLNNLGYCFVTFSTTDEAKKAMVNASDLASSIFENTPKISLKKDRGHIDFDKDYFYETYERIRE